MFRERQPGEPGRRTLAPLTARFDSPREPFEALIEGSRWIWATGGRVVRGFGTIPHQGSVGGRRDLPQHLRRADPAQQYAIDLGVALQLTNILRDVPGRPGTGTPYVPLEDLRKHGCTEADLRRRPPPADRACVGVRSRRCSGSRRSARDYTAAPRGRCRGRSPPPGRGGDHGRDLPGPAAADRTERLRRVLAGGPDSAALAGGDRRNDLGAHRPPAVTSQPDVIVIGGGFAGLSAARAL